jgi:AAHS family benzoate transporter-like MFS transporter
VARSSAHVRSSSQCNAAVVSTFLREASHIGNVTPAIAGLLGSCALVGVMVGALLAGALGDILGRRKVMLLSYACFSVGMAFTAMASTSSAFGWLRFATGLGIGSLVATTAALVSEYAPAGKKNLINAITNGGIPLGSLLAALLAILLMQHIGWRGMFWIGALPIVTLLPLAHFKIPSRWPGWRHGAAWTRHARCQSAPESPCPSRCPSGLLRPPLPTLGESALPVSSVPTTCSRRSCPA